MADLREGEIWGEVTEASLSRLLERKGVPRNTRGTMTSLTQSKEDRKEPAPKPKNSFFATWRPGGFLLRPPIRRL